MARLVVGVMVALLVAAGPAAGQLNANIQALLEDKALQPFVSKVISVGECLSDRNLQNFDVEQCPSLTTMLDALQLGNTNPAVACELTCAMQFAKLNDTCIAKVRKVFSDSDENVGRLGTEFFAACDEVVKPKEEVPAPAPAPVPTLTATDALSSPVPASIPAPEVTVPENTLVATAPEASDPAPPPSPPSAANAALPGALATLAAVIAAALALFA